MKGLRWGGNRPVAYAVGLARRSARAFEFEVTAKARSSQLKEKKAPFIGAIKSQTQHLAHLCQVLTR